MCHINVAIKFNADPQRFAQFSNVIVSHHYGLYRVLQPQQPCPKFKEFNGVLFIEQNILTKLIMQNSLLVMIWVGHHSLLRFLLHLVMEQIHKEHHPYKQQVSPMTVSRNQHLSNRRHSYTLHSTIQEQLLRQNQF